MSFKKLVVIFSSIFLLALAGTTFAKDSVVASIPLGGAPGAIGIDASGNPLSPGTYAVGTLKLHYSDVASTWTAGFFTNFTLHIAVQTGKPKPPTVYPANLQFWQAGSGLGLTVTACTNLVDASFSNSTLTLNDSSAQADCTVQVSIPPQDPSMNFDGAELVGNLQMSTDPGTHLDTVTTIQVHIMLVIPNACLKLYNVITDNGVTYVVDTYQIGAKSNPSGQAGNVQTKSPNNPSDLVYIVNTCAESYPVDIGVNLQSHFAPSPSTGNNLFFFSSSVFDQNPDDFLTSWGNNEFSQAATPTQGASSLCLVNKTVAANTTYLVKEGIDLTDSNVITLPNYPGSTLVDFDGTFSSFTSGVFNANSNCSVGSSLAIPNSVTLPLDFSVTY